MNPNLKDISKASVLVTGAGGGGGNNLINSLKKSSLDLTIIGSNCDPFALAKSNADRSYLLPEAGSKEYGSKATDELLGTYLDSVNDLIAREEISLIIPNNGREVRTVSELRELINCSVFLPDNETIKVFQDKYKMYEIFFENDIPTAKSYDLKEYDDIDRAFQSLPEGDRYWIRMKKGAGSMGATWVHSAEQAKHWLGLWDDLRGYPVDAFTVSEFLPGKDYAFQSVWKDGKPVVMKMVERLSYFFGPLRLSGMSSTPHVAKTVNDPEALATILKAIHAVDDKPCGNFCADLKGDKDGRMCITEFNIGRFCMITPIFDLTGKINTAEAYVRCALDLPIDYNYELDYDADKYMIRELDTLPTICSKEDIEKYRLLLEEGNR